MEVTARFSNECIGIQLTKTEAIALAGMLGRLFPLRDKFR